nr:unnamed protein product [Callosobruchus analis]
MKQVITMPTRISGNDVSLIDVICVSRSMQYLNATTKDMLNLTDHRLVQCNLDYHLPEDKPKTLTYRCFTELNMNQLLHEASNNHWNDVSSFEHVNKQVEHLNNSIVKLYGKHTSLKAIVRRKKIKRNSHLEYYRDLRNYLSFAIKNGKKAYIQHQVRIYKNSPKQLWECLSKWNIHSKSKFEISEKISNANDINDNFIQCTVGVSASALTVDYFLKNDSYTVALNGFLEEVFRTIKSNANPIDGTNLSMLEVIFPYKKNAICHIVNTSLNTSVMLSIWKRSIVLPLAKVPIATQLSDIRAINILPTMSKIIEKIVAALNC